MLDKNRERQKQENVCERKLRCSQDHFGVKGETGFDQRFHMIRIDLSDLL